MISLYLRQLYQRIVPTIVPEDIWESRLTNLALELLPIDARKVSRSLPVLFGLEPALDAVIMNELNSSSALTDLEERIHLIILAVPAETALNCVVRVVLS